MSGKCRVAVLFVVFGLSNNVTADWECMNNHTSMKSWQRDMDYSVDREELLTFANQMDFENWSSKRNWKEHNVSFCDWEGICCEFDGVHNRLTEMHLERNRLRGSFHESFVRAMSKIKVLNFHLNFITNFPPHMHTFKDLQQAKFGRNPICGNLSPKFALLSKLTKFNCNFCCLSGPFPDLFGNMKNLEETFWDGNNFTGPIPSSLGKATNLTKVSFNLNSMTSSIPEDLCNLQLVHDCRIGGDTDFAPYDTTPGSPEKAWLLNWSGNVFTCPMAKCVTTGPCNGKKATPVSPLICK